MIRPFLTICIVNWNTMVYYGECLGSIFDDPDSDDWEVIVVDNASSDDSVEMVRNEFSRVKLLVSSTNLGFVSAIIRAMEEALRIIGCC